MDWTILIILVGLLALYIGLKQLGLVRVETARAALDQGAKVIDVRSPGEYQAGHLDEAVNVPLPDLRSQVSSHVPDKEQVLLVHCLSGTRSALAKRVLRQLGYRQVHNLGSYGRARRILRKL